MAPSSYYLRSAGYAVHTQIAQPARAVTITVIKGHWALPGRVAALCVVVTHDNGGRAVTAMGHTFKRLPTVAAEATCCNAAKQAVRAVLRLADRRNVLICGVAR